MCSCASCLLSIAAGHQRSQPPPSAAVCAELTVHPVHALVCVDTAAAAWGDTLSAGIIGAACRSSHFNAVRKGTRTKAPLPGFNDTELEDCTAEASKEVHAPCRCGSVLLPRAVTWLIMCRGARTGGRQRPSSSNDGQRRQVLRLWRDLQGVAGRYGSVHAGRGQPLRCREWVSVTGVLRVS